MSRHDHRVHKLQACSSVVPAAKVIHWHRQGNKNNRIHFMAGEPQLVQFTLQVYCGVLVPPETKFGQVYLETCDFRDQ